MKKKRIFTKKNKIFKVKNFLFFLIFFIFLYLYNIFYNDKKIFIIEPNKDKFYIIPKDLGGKKIPDYGINILENNLKMDENGNDNVYLNNLIYSLQLYASNSINEIKEKKIFYSKKLNSPQNQFFIVKFDNSLGSYFLLLYMNFTTRDSAKILCDHLKTKDINCLIVNVKNL